MKTKTYLIVSIALLMGMSAWAQEPATASIDADCSMNDFIVGIENGYTWVDLGLPSGLKWATCNIGAEKPEDYGNYYGWGETETKEDNYYYWSTYKYANGDKDKLTKYCNDAQYGDNGFTDNLTTLEPTDDAAHVNWGGSWRMPTYAEIKELHINCAWTWTTKNGVNGYQVTSRTNGNSIFLPAAGYFNNGYYYDGSYSENGLHETGYDGFYWSSSLYEDIPNTAWILYFSCLWGSMEEVMRYGAERGFINGSVRPVCP